MSLTRSSVRTLLCVLSIERVVFFCMALAFSAVSITGCGPRSEVTWLSSDRVKVFVRRDDPVEVMGLEITFIGGGYGHYNNGANDSIAELQVVHDGHTHEVRLYRFLPSSDPKAPIEPDDGEVVFGDVEISLHFAESNRRGGGYVLLYLSRVDQASE